MVAVVTEMLWKSTNRNSENHLSVFYDDERFNGKDKKV